MSLLLAGCLGRPEASSNPGAQQEADNLIQPWYICTATSFGRLRKVVPDPNMAMEQAFAACATEESRVRAYAGLNRIHPQMIDALIVHHKTKMKNAFLAA